jgi:hypothetical protein
MICFPGTKNVVADFLSRQPSAEQSPIEIYLIDEIFANDDEDNNTPFPLAFNVISTHQHANAKLQTLAQTNPEYQTKITGCTPIIHFQDRIVAPKSPQPKIIDWYHSLNAHSPRQNSHHQDDRPALSLELSCHRRPMACATLCDLPTLQKAT